MSGSMRSATIRSAASTLRQPLKGSSILSSAMIVADGSIKLNLLEIAERIKRRVDPSLNCGWPLGGPIRGCAWNTDLHHGYGKATFGRTGRAMTENCQS